MKKTIAIYPGSFNPFHLGHLDILMKASMIFEDVIIARGINPDKNNELVPLPDWITKYWPVRTYNGLLTDFISEFEENIVIIRGLRNYTDLQYELTQYRFLQELNKNINVVSLFCDKEYEHISSSAIRTLQLYGKGKEYLVGDNGLIDAEN